MTALSLQGDLWLDQMPLIRDLVLDLPQGQWSCLLGPSGIGKSSLARVIAGLPGPQRLIGRLTADDGLPLAGRVALLAQGGQLLPWADLVQNVTIGARLRGHRPDLGKARDLLAQVGLSDLLHRKPAALSGGQSQRVALARVLMEAAPVVILDEPFAALDTATRLAMQDLAVRMLAGRTVLLITHDPLEALRLSHRLWWLGPKGAQPLPVPGDAPPRPCRAPDLLAAQGDLLARLQGLAP